METDGSQMYFVSIKRVLLDFNHMRASGGQTESRGGRREQEPLKRTPQSYADCERSKGHVSVVTISGLP